MERGGGFFGRYSTGRKLETSDKGGEENSGGQLSHRACRLVCESEGKRIEV